MDDQPSQDSPSQTPANPSDHSSDQSPSNDSSQDRFDPIPTGSLIAPISKDDALRKRLSDSPHRITWTSKPVQDDLDIPRYPFYHEPPPPPSTFSAWVLPILLFGLTIFTTLWAGAYSPFMYRLGAFEFLGKYPNLLVNGIPFSVTLLTILVTHELGHFIASKIHRVPASFPLFIPGPPHLIGTFGAVIRLRSPIMKRRALFDIGVAGPIAGFIASVAAFVIALPLSHIISKDSNFGLHFGDPLLLQFLSWLMLGPLPPNHDIALHPIGLAAWFGFLVTAINLLPLGQLDGGHVAYAALGDRQKTLGLAFIPILLYLGLTGWPGWFVWVGLAFVMGIAHPPVIDPEIGLGKGRQWVAWSALIIFILTFAPVPISGF